MAETFEILRRTWHIEGRSVRPDHRMVAHTGFLTSARLLLKRPGRGRLAARAATAAHSVTMKMHSPGHSSAASVTASSSSEATMAI